MMPHHSGMNFDKLAGKSNYNDWKFAMEMYLIDKDIWEFVDGTKPKAEDPAKSRMAYSTIGIGVKPEIYMDIRDLPVKSRMAYSTIGIGVKPEIYMDIRDLPVKSRTAAWDELKKWYEDTRFSRKAFVNASAETTNN